MGCGAGSVRQVAPGECVDAAPALKAQPSEPPAPQLLASVVRADCSKDSSHERARSPHHARPEDVGDVRVLPFTEEERRQAWVNSRYFDATPQQASPVALWIVGPSAVGKTTLSAELAPAFGISLRLAGIPDAVLVDGEFFRDAHAAYKKWAKSPEWAQAYPAMKPLINEEKDGMLKSAVCERRHLVIPHTCLDLDRCLADVIHLQEAGYQNHVLAVVAPREEVARRGQERAQLSGKRYAAGEYPRSIAAIRPMIAAANGRYQLVLATELNSGDGQHLGHTDLASGDAGGEVVLDLSKYEDEVLAEVDL